MQRCVRQNNQYRDCRQFASLRPKTLIFEHQSTENRGFLAKIVALSTVPQYSGETMSDLVAESRHTAVHLTGLEDIEMGADRIHVDDKKIINCRADLNQLVPFKYTWAWDKYLTACANHWMPNEISMSADLALWRDPNGLSEDERLIILRNLGFFSTADSLVANNLV